jgi:hypothetical protein
MEEQEQLIFKDGPLRITVNYQLSGQGLTLLKQTVYGTTGIRYQHTNQETKAKDLVNPLFFQLWRSDQVIGLYCLDRFMVSLNPYQLPAHYGRYLTVSEAEGHKGYGSLLKRIAINYAEQITPSHFLFYSFIEAKNQRSLQISLKEEFLSVTRLNTYFFRRLWPMADKRVGRVSLDEMDQVRALLEERYQHYALYTSHGIGYQGNYFALKESGRIVAGIQANPVCWRIKQLPYKGSDLLIRVLPHLPLVRRLFNPDAFAFAAIEGLYLAKGREELLPVLLESVLAQTGLYSAMWQIDERDSTMALIEANSMGAMSGFESDVKTHVLIKPLGLAEGWVNSTAPVYASSFDYS